MRLIILSSVLFISACNSIPIVQSVSYDCGPEPVIDDLSLTKVSPEVLIENNNPYVCMSMPEYEAMAVNLALIKEALATKSAVIRFYKNCITASQNKEETPLTKGAE